MLVVMKTRSVTGLGCLLVLLSAMACEPDDSARNTGKAGQLLAENRTWSRCNFVEGADCYYANPCTEWVDGDTVVGGHTWQRVYYAVDEACSDVRFRGLYRQDVQRLYRVESGKERLLFDFGKEVGEQVRLYASAEHYEVLTVDRIFDTVLPGGGGVPLKAMQIVDERGRVRDVWVENIGSLSAGINGSVFLPGVQIRSVLCVEENAEWIYRNPRFQTCFLQGEIDKDVLRNP